MMMCKEFQFTFEYVFHFHGCPAEGAAVVLQFNSAHAANSVTFPPFFFLFFLSLNDPNLTYQLMTNSHITTVCYK